MAVSALMAACLGCPKAPGDGALAFKTTVGTVAIASGNVEQILTTTGTVRAREHAKMLAEAGGSLELLQNPVTGRRFAIGDEVKEGQLIAIVAAEELRTSSRLDARKQALTKAESEHARNQRLRDEGLVSDTRFAELESALSNARAEYENAVLQQSKARVVTPLSGVLTSVTAAADGEFVTERSTLAEVMRFDEVLVDLDLGAGDVLSVAADMQVRIVSPGQGGSLAPAVTPISGRIERVAPAIDPASRTFRVEVGIDNRDHRLRPGMFVRADIVLDSRVDVLVVPATALRNQDGKWVAFVVEAQRAVMRQVELGLASEDSVEIVSGLRAGDLVVTAGQDTLQDGASVQVRQ
jgi:RND family efflux transporter MFP subunit